MYVKLILDLQTQSGGYPLNDYIVATDGPHYWKYLIY